MVTAVTVHQHFNTSQKHIYTSTDQRSHQHTNHSSSTHQHITPTHPHIKAVKNTPTTVHQHDITSKQSSTHHAVINTQTDPHINPPTTVHQHSHQHINIHQSNHQHTTQSSTHQQFINTSTDQHIDTSTQSSTHQHSHQHTNTFSTQQHIHSTAHQHNHIKHINTSRSDFMNTNTPKQLLYTSESEKVGSTGGLCERNPRKVVEQSSRKSIPSRHDLSFQTPEVGRYQRQSTGQSCLQKSQFTTV
jgi:hypothetical protein